MIFPGRDLILFQRGGNITPAIITTHPHLNEIYIQRYIAGIFQINAGLDSIEDAHKEAKATPATSVDLKQSLEDIEASIDSAGDGLAEEVVDEPDRNVVAKDLAAADQRRRKLIDLTNDSLHDLRDARGIVDSLATDKEDGPLESVGVKIDVAMDGLREALRQLGGKEEVEE